MGPAELPTVEGRALADLARQLVAAKAQIAALRAEVARLRAQADTREDTSQ